MTYIMVYCYSVYLGMCSVGHRAEFPTKEACDAERVVLMSQTKAPVTAICRLKTAADR